MRPRSLKFAVAVVAVLSLSAVIACGGGYSSPAAPTAPPPSGGGSVTADVTVSILGMNGSQSFSPNPVAVKVGQTVAWHNSDSISHTATANAGAFDTGAIAPGSTSGAFTMSTAGTFAYHCSIHPDMVGTITVTQ
jgi:plastocyanin